MTSETFELSQEEETLLEPIVTALSDRARFRITLAYLLDRWVWFVEVVEQGYDDSIYEYTNDLSVRDSFSSGHCRHPDRRTLALNRFTHN